MSIDNVQNKSTGCTGWYTGSTFGPPDVAGPPAGTEKYKKERNKNTAS